MKALLAEKKNETDALNRSNHVACHLRSGDEADMKPGKIKLDP
jgi:hypothetical protein